MFSISFRKHRDDKRKTVYYFDYHSVNSLCSRHHYVTSVNVSVTRRVEALSFHKSAFFANLTLSGASDEVVSL